MHCNPLTLSPLGDAQVEPRIVNQQQQIRFLSQNIGLRLIQKTRNLLQITNNFPQPHDRSLFVMTQQSAACGGHHVPTPTNYLTSIKPFTPQNQLPHNMTSMQIATGLTSQHKHLLFARFYRHPVLQKTLTPTLLYPSQLNHHRPNRH